MTMHEIDDDSINANGIASAGSLSHRWPWVRIDDLADTCSGTTPSRGSNNYFGGSIPWIKTGELRDNIIDNAEEHVTEQALQETSLKLLPKGTLLIAMYGQGQTRGRTGLLAREATINQACFAILPNDKFDPPFLQLWFQSSYERLRAKTEFRGGNQPNLNGDVLRQELVPFPPLAEQRRIAGRLREQLAEVAKARTAVQAQLAAAQALPAAALREVFDATAQLDWPRRPLGETCQLLPSKSICLTGDAQVRAITTACLTETRFDPSGIKTGRMWSSDAADCIVQTGEILIARSNTPELVGRVSMFNGEAPGAVASDLTIRIWPGSEIHGEFLVRYLSTLYLSGYWRERAGGASGTMKKITRSQILAEPIPVPLLDHQRAVAVRLAAELAEATQLRKSLTEKLEAIDRLPAALLAQAFRGGQ